MELYERNSWRRSQRAQAEKLTIDEFAFGPASAARLTRSTSDTSVTMRLDGPHPASDSEANRAHGVHVSAIPRRRVTDGANGFDPFPAGRHLCALPGVRR